MSELKLRDYLVAFLLFAGTFTTLGLAQLDQGMMRDEGTYFSAARQYWAWFQLLGPSITDEKAPRALTARTISHYWTNNNEHPVLCKILFGLSWHLFRDAPHKTSADRSPPNGPAPRAKPISLGWLSEISSFRLPGWFFTALCVAFIYLFGARMEGRLAGFSAALLYITIPRLFFHGQLACFDSPITTMWLLVVYAYYRSLSAARWSIYAGLLFGLALATKHNAWFIPAILGLHYLMVVWSDLSFRPLHLPRFPLVFVALAVLGPLVFLAHWPWLWFDTIAHLKGYFGFHLHHSYYNMEYLGKNWGLPPLPMSYPWVMALFTVPTVTVTLAAIGLWIYARTPLLSLLSRWVRVKPPKEDLRFRFAARRTFLRPGKGLDPRLGTLCFLNALIPLVIIAMPSTPIFGGTKHWMPAYPFWALLGGVAISRLALAIKEHLPRLAVLRFALPLCAALPGALSIFFSHPYGLTQYNALAGGPAGGADLGLNRQFWGYASRQVLPWLNHSLPQHASVYFHDTSYDSYRAYIDDGLLRPDIRYAGMELPAINASAAALVIYELHFNKYDYWIWNAYGTARPSKVLQLDGVPVLSAYLRPKKGDAGR